MSYTLCTLCWYEMKYQFKLETDILSRSASLLADCSVSFMAASLQTT